MVTTTSNSANNRVTVTNNTARFYSEQALGYANQSKNYAENAQKTEEEISLLLENNGFIVVKENIDDIITVADNINNIGDINLNWGRISGDIALQTDLKTILDSKINSADLASVAISGNYLDLANRPDNVSLFNNDSGYITLEEISGKADSENVYTKTEIDTKLGDISTLLDTINGEVQ